MPRSYSLYSFCRYTAFGSPINARSVNAGTSYAYGFNGKRNDLETGTQDYGMRIYNPALGKFLSVDPLTHKFPELTPYQFASNSPIQGIDLDGEEIQNYKSFMKAVIYGFNSLEIQRVDDGIGNVQSQLYTLKAHSNYKEFANLKALMINSPQDITNNFWGEYKPVQKADLTKLSPEDEIMITLQKVGMLFSPIFVRVMNVNTDDPNSFSLTFATLEGHTDAGYITFTGVLDPKTNEITFTIFNETREAVGMGKIIPGARVIQIDQWEDVIGNLKEFLGKDENGQSKTFEMTEKIMEYEYDENQPMGKGKLIEESTGSIIE